MIRAIRPLAVCLCLALFLSAAVSADEISDRAKKLHFSSIVLDTHADTTQRFLTGKFDISKRNPDGHIDIPRMREGGLNAQFFSIWMPGAVTGAPAVQKSLDQIDAVKRMVHRNTKDMMLATSAADVREAHKQHKIAVLMGMEGGHMIANDLAVLRMYGELGVRYMTLTHFYNNDWGDSSTDKPAHNGLTDFGKDVVREMNRAGIVVDISHVSDKTFADALEISKAPLIASHSSSRSLDNHPRNMTDEMIKALAAKGGVIQINYERSYLSQEYNDAYKAVAGDVSRMEEKFKKECGDDMECELKAESQFTAKLLAEGKLPHVSWEKIIDHIDHVAKLVGADHVGLGSDFDGADMPEGMEDCSKLPRITEALLRKGYSEKDIRNILGENILRVMEQVERVSRELRAQP
ncbi:MAG TPA: dipeptidase [Candidatus Dormibacteraeota bacterium]|nr:dipeptidase [Candidatus Dormibacteraeota bacterium]